MLLDLIPAGVVTLAAVCDVRTRRIPNWLTLSALLLGMLLQVQKFGPSGVVIGLAGAALGFGLLLPFYSIRAIGAGDVKLLAAVGALVGPQSLLLVALGAAVIGGLMSVAILARQGRLQFAFAEVVTRPHRMTRSGATTPYAVAIASGVYLATLASFAG